MENETVSQVLVQLVKLVNVGSTEKTKITTATNNATGSHNTAPDV